MGGFVSIAEVTLCGFQGYAVKDGTISTWFSWDACSQDPASVLWESPSSPCREAPGSWSTSWLISQHQSLWQVESGSPNPGLIYPQHPNATEIICTCWLCNSWVQNYTSLSKLNGCCCLKPWRLGVVCYAAIDSWNIVGYRKWGTPITKVLKYVALPLGSDSNYKLQKSQGQLVKAHRASKRVLAEA